MKSCYREAARSLDYPSLTDEQEKALSKFLEGNDLFVSLLTGYGKSLCYAALLRAFNLRASDPWSPSD